MQRRHRLSRSRDFDAVYRHGRSVSTRYLVALLVRARGRRDEEPRLGLAVPKGRRRGVRNRMKRQLREAWRAPASTRPAGRDYVLVVRPGSRGPAESSGFEWLARARGRGSSERVRRCSQAVHGPEVPRHRRSSTPTATRSRRSSRRAPASTTRRCSQYAIDALREYGLVRGVVPRRLAAPALPPLEPRRRRLRARTRGSSRDPVARARSPRSRTSFASVLELAPRRPSACPWAWSIVALTVIVRILLVPLTVQADPLDAGAAARTRRR